MKTRLLAAVALVAGAAAMQVPAQAAAPKSFTTNYAFSDPTPDPTGNANANDGDHCSGSFPQEKPVSVKIPGPGYVDVVLTSTGDWALQLKDAHGALLAGADVNPPEKETVGWRFKKAATVLVLPCNMTGAPSAKFSFTYTYKK